MSPESPYARFGSGKSVRRVEDDALLAGAGRFADVHPQVDAGRLVYLA